jgi:hypothetical protein
METFKILLEQTNAKKEITFKSELKFKAIDEASAFFEIADYICDFVELHANLKAEGFSIVGRTKGITKSGEFHVTLKREKEKAVEFSLRKFGAFVQMNKREKVAHVMGLVYSFIDKHASKQA